MGTDPVRGPSPISGLYLRSGVERGKTLPMHLIFETLPVDRKSRNHFGNKLATEFMRTTSRLVEVQSAPYLHAPHIS
jgi:predicted ATPase